MSGLPWGLKAYRAFTHLAAPAAKLILKSRASKGKEDQNRLNERLGRPQIPRPAGRLVWIHGASVGESVAALPLINRLIYDGTVLVTSGTVASAEVMKRRLPPGVIHQFVPLDAPRAVTRFLDHWKPDAGLFVESELWPNLLLTAAARGVRLVLINARISERSAAGWAKAPKSAHHLFQAFDAVLAQDEDIAQRFRTLGARDVKVVGSLKADAPPLSCDVAALDALKAQIGSRPLLVAAQTHPGEDETVLPAHDTLRRRFPDLLTIIVPRHTVRGADIAMLCGQRAVARRSLGEAITAATEIYVADTMGEMGLFYRLARFCFLGATLVPMGGHNPLEPAVLHCSVISGPHRSSNAKAFEAIMGAQGLGDVRTSADIAVLVEKLIGNPSLAAAMGEAAARGAATQAGAVAATMAVLESLKHARA
jgi:3-deoxy-D-manno-octulosonic-acid transferase